MGDFILLKLIKLFEVDSALAASIFGGRTPGGVTIFNPLPTDNIAELIRRIIAWFIGAAGLIVAAIVVYAAYLFLFSGGDPQKVVTARKTILYAVIGYAILLLSWGIVTIIQQLLGVR